MNPIVSFSVFHPAGLVSRIGMRMLQIVLLAVPLLIVAVPVGLVIAYQRSSLPELRENTDLPDEVQNALKRAAQLYPQPLNGASWTTVHQLRGSDHRLFQLQGANARGNKVEIEITSAGRILEVEEHGIPTAEVPGVVLEALKAKMPRFAPERIEAIYQNEKAQPVSYGFEGRDETRREIEVYVSADGRTFQN